jgi:hypothetical protein
LHDLDGVGPEPDLPCGRASLDEDAHVEHPGAGEVLPRAEDVDVEVLELELEHLEQVVDVAPPLLRGRQARLLVGEPRPGEGEEHLVVGAAAEGGHLSAVDQREAMCSSSRLTAALPDERFAGVGLRLVRPAAL